MLYYTVYVPVPCQDFKGAKIITRCRKYDHKNAVLVKLLWLQIQQRIHYKVILQTFKALHRTSPLYIQELYQVYNPNRSLRSENSMFFGQPCARTRLFGDRRFYVASSSKWNNLPKILVKREMFRLKKI